MARRLAVLLIAAAILAGGGYAAYSTWFSSPTRDHVAEPFVADPGTAIPTNAEFARLAETNPIAMLQAGLIRYERDGIKAFTATLEKQERVDGDLHEREIVRLVGAGEVAEKPGEHPKIRIRMIWETGFRKAFGIRTLGTLYPSPDDAATMTAYTSLHFTKSLGPKGDLSRGASRYCITDAGLYRGMLRTYDAWNKRDALGLLNARYLRTEPVEKAGGRVCHLIQRNAVAPEVDPFALDEVPNPKAIPARDGATEITICVDAELWLQVGTILKRADGSPLAEYFFRDVVLSRSELSPDPFTIEALKAAVKK